MGLLLRMMQIYFATGSYVILDYSFCVLKGLIQLSKKGVFACGFIKKRRYWPSTVLGKEMEDNFGELEVGETDAIQGTVDDVILNLCEMKEPNYVSHSLPGKVFKLKWTRLAGMGLTLYQLNNRQHAKQCTSRSVPLITKCIGLPRT